MGWRFGDYHAVRRVDLGAIQGLDPNSDIDGACRTIMATSGIHHRESYGGSAIAVVRRSSDQSGLFSRTAGDIHLGAHSTQNLHIP